jgi:hypothetical protein
MKNRIKNWIYGLPVVFLLTIGVVVFLSGDPFHLSAPKDEELIQLFRQHRALFEKLVQMVAEDQRHGLYYSVSPSSEKNVNATRRKEYEALLSGIGPKVGMSVGNDEADFAFAEGGWRDRWFKGIKYSSLNDWTDMEISKDLDHLNDLPDKDFYRPLEPKWSIYYEFDKD